MTSLQLTKVDLQTDYNTTELVVKRGQGFTIKLKFNRPLAQSEDGLTITVETGSRPSELGNTRAVMPVSKSGSNTSWSAVHGNSNDNNMSVTINTPANAPVGRYKMILDISNGVQSSSSILGNFVLLDTR
ncbi:protein-glutamine gamma-glutamyltransferase 2-like [Phyllobates terribilis]|uniref:protein-glutamine gamma-glutamyltransferase 2-like n=1 Tax=Phyllobates terribilis TaxID=111132 RepID=UPI003CCAE187